MKKALLPLIVASLVPAAAFADVTVYGKAFVTWQSSDIQAGDQTYTELVSNASRIGLKGSETINDDLKAIYQFEYQTKVDDGSNGGQTFSQRNIFVGLQGNFGTVKMGMFDTPLKLAQEKVDLFNDLVGDMASVVQGETRAKNVVQYTTPEYNHISANFAYVNSEVDKPDTGNGYSASVAYATKTVYLALANDHNVSNAVNKTVFTDDTDILRAVGRFSLGSVTLGAMWESYDNGTVDEDGYLVSAKWDIDPKWALKAQYAQSDMNTLGGETSSLGLDYKLSKNTNLVGYYTHIQDDLTDLTKKRDDNYLGFGIEMNF